MMRLARSAVLAAAMFMACPALAETRMALVIGNSSYAHGGRLANPVNDAAKISAALAHVGFTVTSLTDLGRDGLTDALKTFARDSAEADVALIYFAGHGMEIGGTNYLIPVDATLAADTDVEYEAVPVDRALTAVGRAHRLKVVVLDACRNNPFLDTMRRTNAQRAISVGLARPAAASGMLIAYAAREGSTSSDGADGDSPYATALARHLTETGVDVRILFGEVHDDVLKATGGRQEPSNYDSIGGAGYFLTAPSQGAPAAPAALPPDPRTVEITFWQTVDVGDPAQLKAYLDQYPGGVYAALAKAKLAESAATHAAVRPPQVPMTRGPQAPQVNADDAGRGMAALQAKAYADALRWFRQAAAKDSATGQWGLGLLYATGQGVSQDYAEAMRWYRLAAAQGDARAWNNIGNLFGYGRGVPQDWSQARSWWEKAAARGQAGAQVNLGLLYERGSGVTQDVVEARRWYQMAATQGDAQGQTNLGNLYLEGLGVQRDPAEAARWFRLAAEQGHPRAQYRLGLLYASGRGVDRDPVQARALIGKSASQGDDMARQWLARNPP